MEADKVNLVYFSATYSTRKVMRLIAKEFNSVQVEEYDITQNIPAESVVIGSNQLLIAGVPVYAGRVPQTAVEALKKFKGTDTPAIVVCVYGNRHYDDALLEMKDIFHSNGFKVISAGAFVAMHSIFPEVAANRPDKDDEETICAFARKSMTMLEMVRDVGTIPDILIKGNYPYKQPGKIPLHPKGNRKCNDCGTCVKLCPVQAITKENPRKTDAKKCISCARCIVVCPQHSRHFGKIIYKVASGKFVKANSIRKESEIIYAW